MCGATPYGKRYSSSRRAYTCIPGQGAGKKITYDATNEWSRLLTNERGVSTSEV